MNMMKKILNFWLMAALTMGLAVSVTSCKDDDDELSAEERAEQQQALQDEQNTNFWNVVGQLVGTDQSTGDYQDKTFAPTIGTPRNGNTTIREVLTNDLVTAAQRFSNLVSTVDEGIAIDENTPTYTWTDPAIGTLIYTRTNDGTSLATVDVDIKQVPGLKQIIYLTAEQQGTNGAFEGSAWYRFGDVISKRNADNQLEYWLCVRPAFGKEKKEDSHWLTFSPLPSKNQWSKKLGTDKREFVLPTKLSSSKEHMQNLAEMLYAIADPEGWYATASTYHTDGLLWGFSGVPIFTDFSKANLQYHNQYFWQKVAAAWQHEQVCEKLFGYDRQRMYYNVKNGFLYLLAEGYKQWGSSITLMEYNFKTGTKDAERNLHLMTRREVKQDVNQLKQVIDVSQLDASKPYLESTEFFGTESPRFIVRFASGKELLGTSPDVYQSFDNINGIKDVYVYNKYYRTLAGSQYEPEVTQDPNLAFMPTASDNINGVFMMGDVLEDEDGTRWFCLLAKAQSTYYPNATDDRAYFVTLDPPAANAVKAQGLPTADQIQECAMRLYAMLHSDGYTNALEVNLTPSSQLGVIGEHILRYTGVNMKDLFVTLDSVWNVGSTDVNGGNFQMLQSHSNSKALCLAYDDGSNDHQAVARLICDDTQAGNYRSTYVYVNGKKYMFPNPRTLIYTKYERFDPSTSTPKPEGWTEFGGTDWQWLWSCADTPVMTLQDLTDINKVRTYGSADKWVRLPLSVESQYYRGSQYLTRRSPRTTAETSVSPADFFYKDGQFATTKRSLWNEPVLFMRFMTVSDKGHREVNLTSTDGKRLKVVHLQGYEEVYKGGNQHTWAGPYTVNETYFNNVPIEIPQW